MTYCGHQIKCLKDHKKKQLTTGNALKFNLDCKCVDFNKVKP